MDDAALIFERVRESTLISTRCNNIDHGTLLGGVSLDAAINLAHSRLLSGQWSEAATTYAACVRVAPVKLTGGMFTSAKATSIQARRADIYHWLARAHYGAKNTQGAKRALAAAIHMQPNSLALRCHCIRGVQNSIVFLSLQCLIWRYSLLPIQVPYFCLIVLWSGRVGHLVFHFHLQTWQHHCTVKPNAPLICLASQKKYSRG